MKVKLSEKMKGMAKLIETIIEMKKNDSKVTLLTNDQLANELLEKIWAKLDIASLDSALIGEAIARLANISDVSCATEEGVGDGKVVL